MSILSLAIADIERSEIEFGALSWISQRGIETNFDVGNVNYVFFGYTHAFGKGWGGVSVTIVVRGRGLVVVVLLLPVVERLGPRLEEAGGLRLLLALCQGD
eukprot:4512523-Pleurochrysis_carterae.AAC.1